MRNHSTTISTPIGELTLIASDRGLRAIRLPLEQYTPAEEAVVTPSHPILTQAAHELAEYFAGERRTFDVALDLDEQGTDFQRAAWRALCEIPFGATASYGEQARRLAKPGAARAVGGANSRNPIPIVVPCHRVIGADGAMTGYAGPSEDGIAIKRALLAHERRVAGCEQESLFAASA